MIEFECLRSENPSVKPQGNQPRRDHQRGQIRCKLSRTIITLVSPTGMQQIETSSSSLVISTAIGQTLRFCSWNLRAVTRDDSPSSSRESPNRWSSSALFHSSSVSSAHSERASPIQPSRPRCITPACARTVNSTYITYVLQRN